MSDIFLVTGANSGLGLDSVRRLALMPSTKKVYMGCRSEDKALAAIETLKKDDPTIDVSKLQYVHFDASAPKKDIVQSVDSSIEPLTGLLLNAGGIGHDTTNKPSGPNMVLDVYQINVIGHIQLLEALKTSNKLAKGCHVVYAGSEGARGLLIMMMASPVMGDTSDWFKDQLEGKEVKKCSDAMANYCKAKGFGALYFAEWARQNPDYKVLVVSPGATSGTGAMDADAVTPFFKMILPVMMPVMSIVGFMHTVKNGTDRYMKAVTGEYDAMFPTGTFVASKRGATGAVVDQSTLRGGKMYGDVDKQKAAFEALSVYTASP